jgi:hypothetical protein
LDDKEYKEGSYMEAGPGHPAVVMACSCPPDARPSSLLFL